MANPIICYMEVHANDPDYGGPGVKAEVRQWDGFDKVDIIAEIVVQFDLTAPVVRERVVFDAVGPAVRWVIAKYDAACGIYQRGLEDG